MVEPKQYSVSDELRQLAELFLKGQITKKQFDERAAKTRQIQWIRRNLRRQDKSITFYAVSKVSTSMGEDYILSIEIC